MNAVQRFIRSRVLLLTASILIVAMCLSVLVQGQSQAALNRTVDQNSRGLYDVLVQAKADDNGGLMQPEIAAGQGGISFEQLDALRKLSGTSVAAPISLVSRVTQNLESPRLEATDYLGFNAGLAGTAGDPSATDPSKWPAAESVLSDTPKSLPAYRQRRQLRRPDRSHPVQDHGRRIPRQGAAHRGAGGRRQERPHRGPGGGDRHQVPGPGRRLRAQPLQPLRLTAARAAGDGIRRRRRPRLRARPARQRR